MDNLWKILLGVKMMMNLSKYLDDRLADWAEWYNRHSDGGLGYPKITLEGKLMELGVIIRMDGNKIYMPENKEAEEMERWICTMYSWKPKLALSVRARFSGEVYKIINGHLARTKVLHRLASVPEIARALDISVKVLECNLREAKDYLAGHFLESLEKKRKVA